MLTPWKESYDQPRQHIKKQRITLPTKVYIVKAMVLGRRAWMWEGWVTKNWCLWNVVLEKTLNTARRSNQSILKKSILSILWNDWCWSWSSNTLTNCCKELTHGKDPDAWKDRRQEERGTTEDEMVGWHHRLNEHEFEHALGDGEGQGTLMHCSMWSQTIGHDWATEQQ